MEIYLRVENRVESRPDGDGHLADLEVRVEQSHTIRDVADAVVDFLGLDPRLGRVVSRPPTGPLDEQQTVAQAGLLSGDTLQLGTAYPDPRGRYRDLELVVASGPDVGGRLPLQPGRYTIGRDAGCDLTLSDPQVSRRHLQLDVDVEDRVVVSVLAADRNEVRSRGRSLVEPEHLEVDQVLRLGVSTLVVREQPSLQASKVDAFGQVPFHRTPYFADPVQPISVDPLSDVPAEPEKPRFTYLSALFPIIMGLSFYLMFGSLRFLLFMAFSPVMVVANFFEQRRRSGKKFKESVARFRADLATKAAEVRHLLQVERARRFAASPDVADLHSRAEKRSVDLWVRDRSAYDFLSLRVGVGDLPSAVEVRHADRGDQDFRDEIIEAYGETETVTDVPVTINLAELGVVGLIGRAAETSALAGSLSVQATTLHSPEDLVVLAALAPARRALEWLKWAPHTRSSSSPLAGPHLVDTKERADAMIADLLREAARREEVKGDDARFPWLFVVLDRALEPEPALVSRLLDLCPGVGISVTWLTDTLERVPRQARAVVDCRSPMTGEESVISFTDPDQPDIRVDVERVPTSYATRTTRALAPLRDASSANAATAIPRIVPLFTAFGIEAVDADWVAAQWKVDRGYSLQGPIGYTDSGPMVLDLVEHGPHGLIGGTSGAGKSELVMALVASLIAFNPPTKINFLFIDYKGGASSDLFKDVPHTVGYVTNLDGILSMRALTSLGAELNRRMALMQGKAKDLAEMIEKYPDEAPPSLVIVVDEFATLVKEIPDFVAGVVDIAQRGRSLGIHLMLATQRPSGSINDNIKANTNLRISLRMLDGGESSAVIGTADAAAIPAPLKGRGFAKMGAGDLVAFQSAWAGAPLLAASGVPPVGVQPFGPTPLPATALARAAARAAAKQAAAASATPSEPSTPEQVQVDALLAAIVEATNRLGHQRGRAPWLEVLPSVIPIEDVRALVDRSTLMPGVKVSIGMIDDPEAQRQYPAVLDLARSGGLLVCGSGGGGKTTLLQTVALSAAMDDSDLGGGHLTFFVLDFASRELGGLSRLPQCGGVATSDNIEAVTRILALLNGEFERRRQALADAVARSEAPPRQTTVLLLIDGLDALNQTLEASTASGLGLYVDHLARLLTDGRQVGIHPVVTVPRWGAIRAQISSAISDRLTLRQAEPSGYVDAGVRTADARDLELDPGQAFLNGPNLMQVAMLTPPGLSGDESTDDRQRAEREHLATVAGGLTGRVDPHLVTAPLPQHIGLLPSGDAMRPVVGIEDMTGAAHTLDLTYNSVNVTGDPRSGRSTLLATVGQQVAAAGGEVWVMAPPSSKLRDLTGFDRFCFDEGEARLEFVNELIELAATPGDRFRLLLLDDYDLLPESDRTLGTAVGELVEKVRFVASGPKGRAFGGSQAVQTIRAARTMVLLKPAERREAQEVLGAAPDWHPGLPVVDGRGLVIADRIGTMVQFSDPFFEPSD